jgi:hypothetical protein
MRGSAFLGSLPAEFLMLALFPQLMQIASASTLLLGQRIWAHAGR